MSADEVQKCRQTRGAERQDGLVGHAPFAGLVIGKGNDVLIENGRIVEVAAHIEAPDAVVIDASGKVVMPGFIDTHHHQFETALRSQLAHGILINDGRPANATNYYDTVLQKFSMGYRPQDVYINELFGGISQLDAGVTTVMDVSQIHHSPEHSDAAIEGLRDAGRRGSSAISKAGATMPAIPMMRSASRSSISPRPIN